VSRHNCTLKRSENEALSLHPYSRRVRLRRSLHREDPVRAFSTRLTEPLDELPDVMPDLVFQTLPQ
jgi:hypothetical protein